MGVAATRMEATRGATQPGDRAALRVALVHYWLLNYGGGERVLSALLDLFPQADIFALVANEEMAVRFAPHRVSTSFLQRLPGSCRYHHHLLPLCPFALEQFDLQAYDLVVSSESGPAKGVLTSTNTLHINYCHSPMRYIWDLHHDYANGKDFNGLTRSIFGAFAHYMRMWDLASASRVDSFVANSNNVARRIRKHYRREAAVIYPPVDVARGYVREDTEAYYLTVGRLIDYKRADLAVAACTRLQRPLRVVGEGPQYKRLREVAGSTVEFLGELADAELRDQYAGCRALLFAGEEDFGIVPVEAQSFGRPVIAYGRGGALETIVGFYPGQTVWPERHTGVFFQEQTVESLQQAILAFETLDAHLSPSVIRANAERFDAKYFKKEMAAFVADKLEEFKRPSERPKFQSMTA